MPPSGGSRCYSAPLTTAWMHDSMDGGGRAASGTAAEEVEQRMEQLPRVRAAPPFADGQESKCRGARLRSPTSFVFSFE